MEKMSVQRGLMELKTLTDRIRKATQQSFVDFYVGDEGKPSGFNSVQDCETVIESKYQSATDLIKRRNAIKAAIIKSNAETVVIVGKEEMTVAEAIDRKDSIVNEQMLLQSLKNQFGTVTSNYNHASVFLQQQIDKRIQDEGGADKKLSDEDNDRIVKNTKKRYEPHMVDPLAIRQKIDELEESITQFELNVDVVLSESNAKTEFEL